MTDLHFSGASFFLLGIVSFLVTARESGRRAIGQNQIQLIRVEIIFGYTLTTDSLAVGTR